MKRLIYLIAPFLLPFFVGIIFLVDYFSTGSFSLGKLWMFLGALLLSILVFGLVPSINGKK